MDSCQSFSSSFGDSHATIEPETQKSELGYQTSGNLSRENSILQRESMDVNSESFMGVLEVFIHHARDIHNICIYHKQDVYAKLCLTNKPEITVSTKIVNGGGQNPIFNDNLQLNVGNVSASLKCEIWMLSRVRNYLEDQLLGFALVPLSQVIGKGTLTQEFSLSSTDLFHSPAGFVQLSFSYTGSSAKVLADSVPTAAPLSVSLDTSLPDAEPDNSISRDYNKIEFPDLKIVNENHRMVSEYFGIPCSNLDSESPEDENHLDSNLGVDLVESFSTGNLSSAEVLKNHTSPNSDSSNGSLSDPVSESSQPLCDSSGASESVNQNQVSPEKSTEKGVELAGGEKPESDSSNELPNSSSFAQSALNINIEADQQVMQQQIVDMYMKSMQQFTESLAKMKLPMDIENGTASSDTAVDQKLQASKSTGSRVFYGSRAFF